MKHIHTLVTCCLIILLTACKPRPENSPILNTEQELNNNLSYYPKKVIYTVKNNTYYSSTSYEFSYDSRNNPTRIFKKIFYNDSLIQTIDSTVETREYIYLDSTIRIKTQSPYQATRRSGSMETNDILVYRNSKLVKYDRSYECHYMEGCGQVKCLPTFNLTSLGSIKYHFKYDSLQQSIQKVFLDKDDVLDTFLVSYNKDFIGVKSRFSNNRVFYDNLLKVKTNGVDFKYGNKNVSHLKPILSIILPKIYQSLPFIYFQGDYVLDGPSLIISEIDKANSNFTDNIVLEFVENKYEYNVDNYGRVNTMSSENFKVEFFY